MAEELAQHGYQTGAVVSNPYLHPVFGLDRGFEYYDHADVTNDEIRRAQEVVDTGLQWIDQLDDEPFFLLLHFFDPHMDYDPLPTDRGQLEGEGEWSLPVTGSHNLRATSWEFAEAELPNVESGEEGVEIRLETGVTVNGVVIDGDDGSPIEGAHVELGLGLQFNLQREKETLTDADGRFEIHGIVRDRRHPPRPVSERL